MKKLDIVYILKQDMEDTNELRYSLRSIEKNFPFRKVWFVCGQPKGLVPDGRIVHRQQSDVKWERIKESMWQVIKNDEVTDDFFLFNDDFFVMKPFKGSFTNFVDGTLERRIQELRQDFAWLKPYGRTLYKAQQELRSLGCPEMNYDVHLPMLWNKQLAAASINQCSSPQMRSVYGNINRSPFIVRPDVKVYSMEEIPDDSDFLSTNDDTFRKGAVGRYIRDQFTEPSRFEV
jgi:hypothetical protein